MKEKYFLHVCLLTLAIQRLGVDAQGLASSFRRSRPFRPPAIQGDSSPVVVPATDVSSGSSLSDISVLNDVPPTEVLTGGTIPDFSTNAVPPADSSMTDFSGFLRDPVIQGIEGQQPPVTLVDIPTATKPEFNVPEQPTGVSTLPVANTVPERGTGIAPVPVTDIRGFRPPGLVGLHVDMPGEHDNNSSFPVLHIENHGHSTGHIPNSQGITHQNLNDISNRVHIDMPGEHLNTGSLPVVHRPENNPNRPLPDVFNTGIEMASADRLLNLPTGVQNVVGLSETRSDGTTPTRQFPITQISDTRSVVFNVPEQPGGISTFPVGNTVPGQGTDFAPIPITDIGGLRPPSPVGLHVDMPGEHDNNSSFPVLHIENHGHTTGHVPNSLGITHQNGAFPSNLNDLSNRVHIDMPGEHLNTGSEPVVHRPGINPNRPIQNVFNTGLDMRSEARQLDLPASPENIVSLSETRRNQPVLPRPEPRVPQGVHVDFPGDHGHTGTQPFIHRPEPSVPQGVHVDFPGDHGHTGTEPFIHRPEQSVPQGVHVDFPGDHGHTGTEPFIHRPEQSVPQGVHVDFPGDHGHTGTEPFIHRPEPSVPQGVHIDLPVGHGHTGTRAVVHRPGLSVSQRLHVDLPGEHGNTRSHPVLHRPEPNVPQGVHIDFPGDHGHTGTQPVIHRPEPKVEHGAQKPKSRLPTTEHIALQSEQETLGHQINKPEFNTFNGINIDLSRNHGMDLPLDGHHPRPIDTGSLGKHVSLEGVSPVQRPILQLPIDPKELTPLSSSTKHVDLTSKHDGVRFPTVHKKKDVFHKNKLPLVSAVRDLVNKYKNRGSSLPDKSSHVKTGKFIDKRGPHSFLTFSDNHGDMHGTPIKNTFEPVHRATGFIDIQPDFLRFPDGSHKDPAVQKHKRLDKLPGVVAISPGHHIDLPGEHNNKLGEPAIHTKDGHHLPIDPAGHDPIGFPDHKLSGKDKMTDIFRKPIIDPFDKPIVVVKPKRKPVKDWRLRDKKYNGRRRGKGGRRRKGRGKFRGWKRVHKPKPIFPGKGHGHPKKDLEKPKAVIKSVKKPIEIPVKKPVEKPVKKPVHKDTITIIRIPPRGRPHPLEALRNVARTLLGGFLNRLG